MSSSPQLEILDLRHFSRPQLAPLLRDEALRWHERLHWDYTASTNLLLEYLDSRILPGFVALHHGKVVGYAFCVFEAEKAVIGDVYAFNEGGGLQNPVCETLLHHLIEMLQHTPGVSRIEAQLLMFPSGALTAPFFARGFRAHPRLFMSCPLPTPPPPPSPLRPATPATLLPWRPDFYPAAAQLIFRAYTGHTDSRINDQYQTLAGSERFLHNIIRFPGCGVFDAAHSSILRDPRSAAMQALLLCSRVRPDVAHITQLCVDPTLRSHGLGRTLLQHTATELHRHRYTSLSLTVTESNTPARRLYEHLGFATAHRFDAMVWNAPRD